MSISYHSERRAAKPKGQAQAAAVNTHEATIYARLQKFTRGLAGLCAEEAARTPACREPQSLLSVRVCGVHCPPARAAAAAAPLQSRATKARRCGCASRCCPPLFPCSPTPAPAPAYAGHWSPCRGAAPTRRPGRRRAQAAGHVRAQAAGHWRGCPRAHHTLRSPTCVSGSTASSPHQATHEGGRAGASNTRRRSCRYCKGVKVAGPDGCRPVDPGALGHGHAAWLDSKVLASPMTFSLVRRAYVTARRRGCRLLLKGTACSVSGLDIALDRLQPRKRQPIVGVGATVSRPTVADT